MKNLLYIIAISLLFHSCSKDGQGLNAGTGTGTGGSTARFTIAGNFLYVVDHTSLKAFDISSTTPVLKSKTDVGVNIETIFPYEGKLFIGSSSAMHIFSLENPADPKRLAEAHYIIRMSCDPVVAQDDVAYATLNASGPCGGGQSVLVVYDISNIEKPELKNTINLIAPFGLGVQDNALYVCEGAGGLRVFDINDKLNPVQKTEIMDHSFFDVIPYGNVLIAQVENGLAFYDITNRHNPIKLSKLAY